MRHGLPRKTNAPDIATTSLNLVGDFLDDLLGKIMEGNDKAGLF
jgi:hypothetical protein